MRTTLFSLLAATRLAMPLIVLVALTMLMLRGAGAGVGFVAGLVFAMALTLHALVFGAREARKAFPPVLARALLAIGMIVLVIGAAGAGGAFAAQIVEAGLFVLTAAGLHLVLSVLIGRAPTLRDGDAS